MADNYLEKRYEETLGKKTVVKRVGKTLDELLTKNRSTRGFNTNFIVPNEWLSQIVAVNTKIGSACNQQALRFRLVNNTQECQDVLNNIKMGAALPELHLPLPDTEPTAFVIVCSIKPETKLVDIDLGISLQSMSLKAVELGLNTLIVGALNKDGLKQSLALPFDPLAVLCIGKSAEQIKLVPIHQNDSHAYWREKGVHYVPKVCLDELIIK